MRIALLVAASALLAGCSAGAGDAPTTVSALTTPSPPRTSSTPASTTPSTSISSTPAPGKGVAEAVAWVESGPPADPAGFRTMTRDGVSTPVGDGVAFTTAGTEANCVTNRYRDGALACLIKLSDPPPRPAGIETAWKDNWVDFDGTSVDVGSPHGDPGPFVDGTGAQLPAGQSLAFGDYRCRADPAGLLCVNYAHQSAVRLSAAGIEPFGCLRKVAPPADIGLRFAC